MAKASPEGPEKAPEPVEPKPSVGTWPKSEHILHAAAMYGQPQWLIDHVLVDVPADKPMAKVEVAKLVNDFLKHQMEVED